MSTVAEASYDEILAQEALTTAPLFERLEDAAIRLSISLMGSPTGSALGAPVSEILAIRRNPNREYILALTGLQDALRDLDKHRKGLHLAPPQPAR